MRFPLLALSVLLVLAACHDTPDRATPPPETAEPLEAPGTAEAPAADVLPDTLSEAERTRLQALDTALDSLEALVITLEHVEGPIAAWNRADEAARLLRYLEQNRSAFALDLPEEEAARRYPSRISRLNALEARRSSEMQRIGEDRVAMQVLLEEIAKADAEDSTASAP
jgi:hypothetical protein